MKIAIVYSSNTGNTKMLAETIKNALNDKDIAYFGKVNDGIPDSDLYIIGSWTNKGNASLDIQNFLKKLRNKKIVYFATAGYGGSDSYYNTLYGRVKEIIDPSNKILGHFYCQGKMPIAVRDRYVSMITQNPDDAKLKVSLQNFDEALNHPNNKDLKNVEQWIKDIINNN